MLPADTGELVKVIVIQIINYTLAFFMWMIIGRLLLTFFVRNKENVMVKFFVKFTEPVYNITRKILPFAKESCIPLLSVFLVILVRFLLIIVTKPEIKP